LVNVALAAVFFVYDRLKVSSYQVSSHRKTFADHQAYTRLSKSEIDGFLNEQYTFDSLGLRYAPWVLFRNPVFRGHFLNTDERGFRHTKAPRITDQKPLKVYVFGGSTTFGYGVPDDYTIPSYLQQQLEREYPSRAILVKNFAQYYYYSSQEQLLLLSLLKDGDVPDWAVFIDGFNDIELLALRHDEPSFTPVVKRLWNASAGDQSTDRSTLRWIPMVRLAQSFAHRLLPVQANSAASSRESNEQLSFHEDDRIFEYVITRYTSNLRITRSACQEFEVRCLFVWQPHPAYKYDRRLHKTFPWQEIPAHYKRIYAHMEAFRSPDFLYLGDLTEQATQKVYVDSVHYNEATNEQIAVKISKAIRGN